MTRYRMPAIAHLALALAFAALVGLLLFGCTDRPANARALHTADAGAQAIQRLATDPAGAGHPLPDLDEAQHAALVALLDHIAEIAGGVRELLAPPRQLLDPDGQYVAVLGPDEMIADRETTQRAIATLAQEAQQEADSAGFWSSVGSVLLTTANSVLGLSLGAAGVASGLGAAFMTVRKIVRKGRALAHAVGFGERADQWVQRNLPPEMVAEWTRERKALAASQDADGVRQEIRLARRKNPTPTLPPIGVVTADQANARAGA